MTTGTVPAAGDITQAVHDAARPVFREDSCIACTRITIEVCAYFGVPARPQPVKVAAWTARAWELKDTALPPDQWPREAWSTGILTGEQPSRPGRWNGHLVAVTATDLIDPSLSQLSRPDRGLHLAAAAFTIPPGWQDGEQARITLGDGTVLVYIPVTNHGYRASPHWSRRSPTIRRVVGAAIRALTAELEPAS